jgi:hypothetical protein
VRSAEPEPGPAAPKLRSSEGGSDEPGHDCRLIAGGSVNTMRLVLHQALTDIRAQRWLAAAWAAMLAATCAFEALKLEGLLGRPLLALSVGRVVLGWVLAIRIVHADPLDGTRAFWLTRPLSPSMLLAAKGGLLCVLLLVVPGAAALVVFIMNGFAPSSLPGILGQWLLIEALPLLPIVLVATLTRDVARMVLTLIAGVVAWGVLQASCWKWSMLSIQPGAVSAWQSSIVQAWLVIGTGVVVLCGTLTARQYLTRRTSGVAFAALVAALGIVAMAALWPIQLTVRYLPSWDDPAVEPASPGWHGAGDVSVSVQEGSLRLVLPGALDQIVGDLRVEGLADDVVVRTAGGRGTLRFLDDGEVVEQRRTYASGFPLGLADLEDATSRRHFERVLGVRLVDPVPPWWNGLRLVAFKPGTYAAHRGRQAIYEASLLLDAYRIEAAAATALKKGASVRVGDVSTTVLGVRWQPKPPGWVIDVREAAPRILLPGSSLRVVHLLRNRKRGEAMVLSPHSAGDAMHGQYGMSVMATRLTYVPFYGAPPGVSADAAWLEDAELILVSFERLARFRKHVTLANVVLPEAAGSEQQLKK